jgi:hypothetical protein
MSAEGQLNGARVFLRSDTGAPIGGYALAALGGALALFLLGMSPFMWNGWDLAHDSRTQTWSLKRYGKVVWSSRGSVDPGPGARLERPD